MAQETPENREKILKGVEKAVIREDILQNFPRLFGTKTVNGRKVNVEQEIAAIAKELHPEIAAALTARRTLLNSPETVREKYAWPKWDDTFEDPVTKKLCTYRQIIQGLIDNFLGVDSEYRWGGLTTKYPSRRTPTHWQIPAWNSPDRGIHSIWPSMR